MAAQRVGEQGEAMKQFDLNYGSESFASHLRGREGAEPCEMGPCPAGCQICPLTVSDPLREALGLVPGHRDGQNRCDPCTCVSQFAKPLNCPAVPPPPHPPDCKDGNPRPREVEWLIQGHMAD